MLTEPGRLRAEKRFQDAYARFLTDRHFRERVLAPSTHAGVDPELGDVDVDRLRAMDQDRIELFANCLFGNRMAAIEEAFPLTVKVIGGSLPALIRMLDDYDVAVDTRKYAEAVRFADFIFNGPDADPCLSDSVLRLLRYEFIMLNLRVRPRWPAWPEAGIRSPEALREALENGRDVGLVMNENHAVVTVGFDVEVLRDLPLDSAPFAEATAETIVLLHRSHNGAVHQMHLNHASAAAILMIDGACTFRGLATQYAAWLGEESSVAREGDLARLCISLCGCGALCFEAIDVDAGNNLHHSAGNPCERH